MKPSELRVLSNDAFEALVDFWSEITKCDDVSTEVDLLIDEDDRYNIVTKHEPMFARGAVDIPLDGMSFRFNAPGASAFYEGEAKRWVRGRAISAGTSFVLPIRTKLG